MTFTETLHPRGQAGNPGQFREKTNDAPTGALIAPSPGLAAADAQLAQAAQTVRREAVREMIRVAPDGAERIVFELYGEGDPETELFAFQCIEDADGEDIELSAELKSYYWDLGSRIDFELAEEDGFSRDNEMFVLDVPPTDPAKTAADLADAITLLQFTTFNPGQITRAQADERVHAAAAAHIRAIAGKLSHPVDRVILAHDAGVGLHLARTERADGTAVHDHQTYRHPAYAADVRLLDEITFAASNIRQPALAGIDSHPGGRGLFALTLNP